MNVLHREIMYASCVAPHIIERVSTDKGAITLCLIALTTLSYLFFWLAFKYLSHSSGYTQICQQIRTWIRYWCRCCIVYIAMMKFLHIMPDLFLLSVICWLLMRCDTQNTSYHAVTPDSRLAFST